MCTIFKYFVYHFYIMCTIYILNMLLLLYFISSFGAPRRHSTTTIYFILSIKNNVLMTTTTSSYIFCVPNLFILCTKNVEILLVFATFLSITMGIRKG